MPIRPTTGDPYHLPQPGDRASVSAGQMERLIQGTRRILEPGLKGHAAEGISLGDRAAAILISNRYNTPLPVYSAVGVGETLAPLDVAGGTLPPIVVRGVATSLGTPLAITQQYIPAGGIGRAVLFGPTWVRAMHPITGQTVDALGEDYLASQVGGRCWVLRKPLPTLSSQIVRVPVLLTPGGGCPSLWYLIAQGMPDGGTATFDITVNSITEEIEFPCPCTLAQTTTALETHSEIVSADVTGGTLPAASQTIVTNPMIEDISAVSFDLVATSSARPIYYWEHRG